MASAMALAMRSPSSFSSSSSSSSSSSLSSSSSSSSSRWVSSQRRIHQSHDPRAYCYGGWGARGPVVNRWNKWRRWRRRRQCAHGAVPLAATARMQTHESRHLLRAAELSLRPLMRSAPAPRSGVVIVDSQGRVLAEAFSRGQGSADAEVLAVGLASRATRYAALDRVGQSPHQATGADQMACTVYSSLEPCGTGLSALVAFLRKRPKSTVFIGIEHPIGVHRGRGIKALREANVEVVLASAGSDSLSANDPSDEARAHRACLEANESLIHAARTGMPFSIMKYAMTLDGRIATSSGHAAWVSCEESRRLVHRVRACSNAVIVGGETVRQDDPRLTVRLPELATPSQGGETGALPSFRPIRIVLSRSMNLPMEAKLWDVTAAPTIVMTEPPPASSGADKARETMLRKGEMKAFLRRRGVEVVELPTLTPRHVMDYCHMRGFLQVLWECGGTLMAPAISDGVIHKVMAFTAPKICGGTNGRAHAPVGNLDITDMRQAYVMNNVQYRQIGDDMLTTGYLNGAGAESLSRAARRGGEARTAAWEEAFALISTEMVSTPEERDANPISSTASVEHAEDATAGSEELGAVWFYKPWGAYGQLSNFSSHAVFLDSRRWPSVEHYYQASKFAKQRHPHAQHIYDAIGTMALPEIAARQGRAYERACPHLIRSDWAVVKREVMLTALRAKFAAHEDCRECLLATGRELIVESSPNDYFWGCGYDRTGNNVLGKLLMVVREELRESREEGDGSSGDAPPSSYLLPGLYPVDT